MNSKKTINIINNVYYVKQVFKLYIYIIRALYVLQFKKSYKLNYVFESINYKKIKKSFYWLKQQKVIKSEIALYKKNNIWKLITKSKNRVVISKQWVFKIKYSLNDRILCFKARWIVYKYKQLYNIDYNEI